MTTFFRMKIKRLSITALCCALVLVACDNSGPDSNGNTSAPADAAGSQPLSTLTFATDPNLAGGEPSNPGNSALRTTLATQSATRFDDLQLLVFGPMCAGCHTGGGLTQPSVMDLTTADASFAALVNQPGFNDPQSTLVVPGNASSSYLLRTLHGTQTTGSRMPMRAAPLNEELLASVQAWIDNGAQR